MKVPLVAVERDARDHVGAIEYDEQCGIDAAIPRGRDQVVGLEKRIGLCSALDQITPSRHLGGYQVCNGKKANMQCHSMIDFAI